MSLARTHDPVAVRGQCGQWTKEKCRSREKWRERQRENERERKRGRQERSHVVAVVKIINETLQ